MSDLDFPVCQRMLRVEKLNPVTRLPRDVPPEQLRSLLHEIQIEAASEHGGLRRMGKMDLAWFTLMLHSGLRTGEVCRLRQEDVDWEGRRVFIEQSKGLKDRIVYLSPAGMAAIRGYLEVRGPAETLPDHLFVYRHQPLSQTYCSERLQTYGERCTVRFTPHQLRHSCATLLLNAGAPILTVQAILGHKWVDTTLGYARLYDGTVAADYFAAMTLIEQRLAMPEDRGAPQVTVAQLVALVDSLCQGTLNPAQTEVVRQLRVGLGMLVDQPMFIP